METADSNPSVFRVSVPTLTMVPSSQKYWLLSLWVETEMPSPSLSPERNCVVVSSRSTPFNATVSPIFTCVKAGVSGSAGSSDTSGSAGSSGVSGVWVVVSSAGSLAVSVSSVLEPQAVRDRAVIRANSRAICFFIVVSSILFLIFQAYRTFFDKTISWLHRVLTATVASGTILV